MGINRVSDRKVIQKPETVFKAFFKAADLLEVANSDLELISGLSQSTLSRKSRPQHDIQPVNTKSYESILLFLRMFRSLDSLFGGNISQCKEWLRANNRGIGGRPIEHIKGLEGLVRVAGYLDAMRAKV